MSLVRLVPASSLRQCLATIILSINGRRIKSRVFMVQHSESSVRVAFESGDMVTLSPRSMVARIEQ